MKHRLIIAAAILAAATGCSSTRYFVSSSNYALLQVESPEVSGAESKEINHYSDEYIDISLSFDDNEIGLTLGNNTGSSMKVLWDDAAFIDQFGNAHRIIHLGTKLADRDKAQVPSVIPKGAKITDSILPADCVEWSVSTSRYVASDWKFTPFSQMYCYATKIEAETASKKASPIRLMLTMESGDGRLEYVFTFMETEQDIKSVTVTDWNRTLWAWTGISCALLMAELVSIAH